LRTPTRAVVTDINISITPQQEKKGQNIGADDLRKGPRKGVGSRALSG